MSDEVFSSENEIPPMDDGGINNDHILDLCDFIIKSLWKQHIETKPSTSLSIPDLKDMSQTLLTVWGLVQEILDLDRKIRMQADNGDIDQDFFDNFDGFPPDSDEDEDEDEG